jgi:hypothetical protein
MSIRSNRLLFRAAAIFNWLAALALAFQSERLFDLLRISPAPTEPLFLQLFAWLVFVFGIGYWWAASDPVANAPIIRLGMLGKWAVVLVALFFVLVGAVSWQIMLLAGCDGLFALLFAQALAANGRRR